MDDIRFRALDVLDPPDSWEAIIGRDPAPGLPAELGRRPVRARVLAVAAVAIVVIAGGVAIGQDREHAQTVRSAGRPRGGAASIPLTTGPAVAPTVAPIVLGRISIPAAGVKDVTYLEGTDRSVLRHGVGHDPHSPLPGQAGNVVLVGRRSTDGAPFHDLDRLATGDPIRVGPAGQVRTYRVRSLRIVAPTQTSVLADAGDDRLTLITTHPGSSAGQRLVVVADLVGDPAPTTPPTSAASASLQVTADPTSAVVTLRTCTLVAGPPKRVEVTGTVTGGRPGPATITVEVVSGGSVHGSANVVVPRPAAGAVVPLEASVPVAGDVDVGACRVWKVSLR